MRREELVAAAAWASAKNGCPCRSRMAVVLWQGARLVTPHRCGGTCDAGVSTDHYHCRSQRALESTQETHRLVVYYVGMEVDLRGERWVTLHLRLVRVLPPCSPLQWSGQLEAALRAALEIARSHLQAIAHLAGHDDARIWDQFHKRLVGKLQQHARQMHPSRLLTP